MRNKFGPRFVCRMNVENMFIRIIGKTRTGRLTKRVCRQRSQVVERYFIARFARANCQLSIYRDIASIDLSDLTCTLARNVNTRKRLYIAIIRSVPVRNSARARARDPRGDVPNSFLSSIGQSIARSFCKQNRIRCYITISVAVRHDVIKKGWTRYAMSDAATA